MALSVDKPFRKTFAARNSGGSPASNFGPSVIFGEAGGSRDWELDDDSLT